MLTGMADLNHIGNQIRSAEAVLARFEDEGRETGLAHAQALRAVQDQKLKIKELKELLLAAVPD